MERLGWERENGGRTRWRGQRYWVPKADAVADKISV